jgi:pimeloyl-ACP methyl ester carboxylesterase
VRRRRLIGGVALAAGIAGCVYAVAPIPRTPMQTLRIASTCGAQAPALVVMLPGVYSRPEDFVDEGFVDALRRRAVAADVWIADAHLGYVIDKSLFVRLHDDVIGAARAQGYRRVWLLGISLGGFGALGYALQHEAELEGVIALAPYLGPRPLELEIAAAGGPKAWQAPAAAPSADEPDRALWAWLAAGAPRLPIYLGWGREDRFATINAMAGALLPPERISQVPGGHDWPAWRALWEGWLDRGLLPTACTATAE